MGELICRCDNPEERLIKGKCQNCYRRHRRIEKHQELVQTEKIYKNSEKGKITRRKFDKQDYQSNLRTRWRKSKWSAENKRKVVWNISFEDFEKFSKAPCYYCGKFFNQGGSGLDRLNNEDGYTINNVVTCCKWCNRLRSNHLTVAQTKFIVQMFVGRDALQELIDELHLAAYRYVDGRSTYITSYFNELTKKLLHWGFELGRTQQVEGRIFAKDGMGWQYSGVSKEEHETGLPKNFNTFHITPFEWREKHIYDRWE